MHGGKRGSVLSVRRYMLMLLFFGVSVSAMSACAGAAGNAPATPQPTPTAASPQQPTEAPATATMETLKSTLTPERLSSPLATPAAMTPTGSSAQSPATAAAPEQITLPTGVKSMCAQVTEQGAVEVDKTGTDQPVVAYDAGANTITVRAGAPATLAGIQAALGQQPDVLRELKPGEWLLAANVRVDAGAVMRVAAPDVRWLKLRSDDQGFVWIKAMGGQLSFSGVCVTSWDTEREGYDENVDNGRSFVLARNAARMDIHDSELSYLGYEANESYGVAWRMPGTSGEIINSKFGNNFYGLYFHEASDVVIRGNEVHHSVRYGIDPHTASNRLLIENNISHDNGKQGIILAEGCSDSTIRNNMVYSNTLHGIVIYQNSNNNLVEGNLAFGNALQGINVNNSSNNTIRGNVVDGNAEAGIGIGQDAKDNIITGNTARHSLDGIYVYSNAQRNVLSSNRVSANERYGIYIKSDNNQIAGGNEVFGNAIGVYINVPNPDGMLDPQNHIHDNREDNVRVAGKSG